MTVVRERPVTRQVGPGPDPIPAPLFAAPSPQALPTPAPPTPRTAAPGSERRGTAAVGIQDGDVDLPIASVALDVPLAHLDRPFDYLVPPEMSPAARVGVRVRVRFAGKAVGGYVVARSGVSAHTGRLTPLGAVVSAEPVLTPEVLRLARHVADRCAGTLADVLRLAVPPRHARVEAEPAPAPTPAPPATPTPTATPTKPSTPAPTAAADTWDAYAGGAALVRRLGAGESPRAAVAALPGSGPGLVAAAVAATVASGRGALVVVPDGRDVAAFSAGLTSVLGAGVVTELTADLGPAQRYRSWLAVRRGTARVVVGTRAAAFAPVADLGLVVCWDDGDDLHAEPRAPHPHTRDVLVRRSVDGAGLLLAGHVVTPEAVALARDGFLAVLAPDRALTRAVVPRVVLAGDDREMARDAAARAARLPALVLRTVREALPAGPVLVQVPRAGYVPVLACERCRHPAVCGHCAGPLAVPGTGAVASCRWCARPAAAWTCPECGAHRFRSRRVGSVRTAEELGRGFPGVAVLQSAAVRVGDAPEGGAVGARGRRAGGVRATVPDRPALVVATPGAEPVAERGYSAAVLLDGDVLLARPELAATQEALRRWVNAAALVRTGGTVVLVADAGHRAAQALVRWDPVGAADAELDDRVATALPPASVVVELVGAAADAADLVARAHLPDTAEVLGPVPLVVARPPARPAAVGSTPEPTGGEGAVADPVVRLLVRDRRGRGAALTQALSGAQAARTARKLAHVRMRVDPVDLG